jgi:hypothetical protein
MMNIFGGTLPCNRFFLFGNCPMGDKCRYAHKGSTAPTEQMLAGLEKRIKAKCAEIVANPKNE